MRKRANKLPIKDLGVLTSKDISFSEHIDDIVLSSKINLGLLLRTFRTKKSIANDENVQFIHKD